MVDGRDMRLYEISIATDMRNVSAIEIVSLSEEQEGGDKRDLRFHARRTIRDASFSFARRR